MNFHVQQDYRTLPSGGSRVKKVKENTIIDDKRKIGVVQQSVLLLEILVIFAALVIPFIAVRRVAANVSDFLLKEHLRTRAHGLSSGIGSKLSEVETLSEYLAAVNGETYLMRCEPNLIYYLVSFLTKIADHSTAAPARVVLSQPDYYSHIEGNSSNLELYVGFVDGDNMTLKRYNESASMLPDFDYQNQGVFVRSMSVTDYKENFFNASQNGTFWENVLYMGNDFPNRPHVDANTALFVNGRLQVIVSVSLWVDQLMKGMQHSREPLVEGKYALVDLSGRVLFESDMGVISPVVKYVNARPFLRYPTVGQLDDEIWNSAAPVLADLPDNTIGHFDVGVNEYICISYPIVPRKVNTSHRVYLVLAYDNAKEKVYGSTVYTVSVTVVAVLPILFVSLWLLQINESKKQERLRKERLDFSANRPEGSDLGVLEKTIRRLRELELLFPEEVVLNKVVDAIVVHLTEKRYHQFGECIVQPHRATVSTPANTKEPFGIWKYLSLRMFKLENLEFDYDTYAAAPGPMLVKLFVTLLCKHQLIFKEIDPDALITFLVDFTDPTYIRNPVHTAHVLYLVHVLISGPFNYWISDKVELLALFFTAFVMDVKMDWESMRCVDDGQQEDAAYQSEHDAMVSIQKQNRVLTDDYFVVERNVEWVMSLLRVDVLLDPQDPVSGHFKSLVRELSFSLSDKMEFELLGEARVRVQSPRFSVQDDVDDRYLFMKCILKLCSYSAYLSKKEEMIKEIVASNIHIMTENELRDDVFVCAFHVEMASKIVRSWLSVFTNFNPLEDMVGNLEHTIKYWRNQLRKSTRKRDENASDTDTASNTSDSDE